MSPGRTVLSACGLPGPAPPPRRAPRPDPLVTCPGFRIDKFVSSRWPISIFGPIFKVQDRSKDPDLRIAEGSWWPERGRKKKFQGSASSILPAEKIEDRAMFFVIRVDKVEDGSFFVLRTKKFHPLPSSVRYSTHSSAPKIEDSFFDLRLRRAKIEDGGKILYLRLRRSKIGGSSIFGSEDRRWDLRSSAPKIED